MEDKQCRSYFVFYISSNRQDYKLHMYTGDTSFIWFSLHVYLTGIQKKTKTNSVGRKVYRRRRKQGPLFILSKCRNRSTPTPPRPAGPQITPEKSSSTRPWLFWNHPLPPLIFSLNPTQQTRFFHREYREWRFPLTSRCERGNGRESLRTGRRKEEKKIPFFFCFPSQRGRRRKSNAILTGTGPTATKTFR